MSSGRIFPDVGIPEYLEYSPNETMSSFEHVISPLGFIQSVSKKVYLLPSALKYILRLG